MEAVRLVLLAALLGAAVVSGNLNYLSPSTNHPSLAIPLPSDAFAAASRFSLFFKRSSSSSSTTSSEPIAFTHGVASGDPSSTSVILWTRAVPLSVDPDKHKYGASSARACVAWEVSAHRNFSVLADAGTTSTGGEVDYTVKIEATGLSGFAVYWYRFKSCGRVGAKGRYERRRKERGGDGGNGVGEVGEEEEEEEGGTEIVSEVGRTRTLPDEDDPVAGGVRFAVYSCANFAEGYFNAYGMSARKDSVDYVLHLGDYIYELPLPTVLLDRIPKPFKETVSLRDYRMRLATARTDEDLLLSHRTFPWIPIWIANNGWRNGLASPLWMYLEWTTWQTRLHAGLRAYYEWLPLRPAAASPTYRIFRHFKFGRLLDLLMLDTRYYSRDRTDVSSPAAINAEHRSIMGADQEAWLYAQLAASARRNATWAVLAQQIQFSNINETAIGASRDRPLYYDGWSGYQANRRRVLETLVRERVRNPVVLTGDYHALWTADLTWSSAAQTPRYREEGREGKEEGREGKEEGREGKEEGREGKEEGREGKEEGREGKEEGSVPAASVPLATEYDWESGAGSLGVELAVTSVTSANGYGPLSHAESTRVSRMLVEDNAPVKWAEAFYRGYAELAFRPHALRADYWAVPDVTTRNALEERVAVWECLDGERRLRRPLPRASEGAVQTRVREWALTVPEGWRV